MVEPELPEGYETLTVLGITVARPPGDGVLTEPTAFAYVAAGLLEEAAKLAGTDRRERVTIIVYGSIDEFHDVGRAPSFASGLYDGAVKPTPRAAEAEPLPWSRLLPRRHPSGLRLPWGARRAGQAHLARRALGTMRGARWAFAVARLACAIAPVLPSEGVPLEVYPPTK
jgi:hypothetical protein